MIEEIFVPLEIDDETLYNWQSTQILNCFSDDKIEQVVSCLESQRLCNQKFLDDEEMVIFKRISIFTLVRILMQSKTFRNNTFAGMQKYTVVCDQNLMVGDIKHFNTRFTLIDAECQLKLNAEADYICVLSKLLLSELDDMFAKMNDSIIYFGGFEMSPNKRIAMKYVVHTN